MTLKNIPSLRQLSVQLGRDYRRQFSYIAYGLPQVKRYKEFEIPKKSGGVRKIIAPKVALLKLQQDIKTLLEADYSPRTYVHGFVSNQQRSIISNAQRHIRQRWVLNFDLADFFETIHVGRITGRLQANPYNYPKEIADFVAHISCYETVKNVDGSDRLSTVLMTGSPLSPVISNIICDRLDSELSRYCRNFGLIYSRYADDITISSNRRKFPRRVAHIDEEEHPRTFLSEELQSIIERNGFQISHKKTRLQERSIRQEVTGLVVNERVNVKRKFVRNLRAMLNDWEKNGFDEASRRHFEEKRPNRGRISEYEATNFDWVVRGKIEFVKSVKGATDPVYQKIAKRYNELCPDRAITLPLVTDGEILEASVWYLENDTDAGSVGTCFAIDQNRFVTCAHCVGEDLRVFHPANRDFPLYANLVQKDDVNDIAIIEVTDPLPAYYPREVLQIATDQEINSLEVGVSLQSAGFPSELSPPMLRRHSPKLNGFSTQSFKSGQSSDRNCFALSDGTFEGMSGGPILHERKVVGVIVRGPNQSDRTLTPLAVKAIYLNNLINSPDSEVEHSSV